MTKAQRPPTDLLRLKSATTAAEVISVRGSYLLLAAASQGWSGPVRIRNDLDASHFSHFEAQEVGQ
jgi:hypothetical protein